MYAGEELISAQCLGRVPVAWSQFHYYVLYFDMRQCTKEQAMQIRSHAQKYFLKVQKSGTSEHVPPPRPKRKASHPYPQKAPKKGRDNVNHLFVCYNRSD